MGIPYFNLLGDYIRQQDSEYVQHYLQFQNHMQNNKLGEGINEYQHALNVVLQRQKTHTRRIHKGSEFYVLGFLHLKMDNQMLAMKYFYAAYIEDLIIGQPFSNAYNVLKNHYKMGEDTFETVKKTLNDLDTKGLLVINPFKLIEKSLEEALSNTKTEPSQELLEKMDELITHVKNEPLRMSVPHEKLNRDLVISIYSFILQNPTTYSGKGRSIAPARKNSVKERDGFQCQLCNKIFPKEELQVDHIYPSALGGSNQDSNLMAVCEPCNSDKGKRLDYYQSREGKEKLLENIQHFVNELLLIKDFKEWIEKIGDKRRKTMVP